METFSYVYVSSAKSSGKNYFYGYIVAKTTIFVLLVKLRLVKSSNPESLILQFSSGDLCAV